MFQPEGDRAMKVYLVLLMSGLSQFASHFSNRWIDRTFGNGWAQLFSYALGVFVNAPFLDMLMAEFEIPQKKRRIAMLAYFATFFFGGMGCLIGWIVQPSPNHSGIGK
jgi:hypothetical protein